MKDPVAGSVRVVGITMADPDATSENYELECVVSGPGIEPTACVHKGYTKTKWWPTPGDTLPATIDRKNPTHFVIDFESLPTQHDVAMERAEAIAAQMRDPGAEVAAVPPAGPVPVRVTAADVLARGTRGSATVLGTFPSTEAAPPDHTIVGLMLNVMIDGHRPYQVQALYNAPNSKLEKLSPGALLPVAADPAQLQLVAVDWDAV
jgi:hypothetical protein